MTFDEVCNPTPKQTEWESYLQSVKADLRKHDIEDNDPERFAEMVAKIYCREMKDGKGILLRGNTGCGKTRRMRYLANSLNISMMSAQEIGSFWMDAADDNAYNDFVCTSNVSGDVPATYHDLIIDDLGAERVEYVRFGERADVLRELLEKRYEKFPRWKTHITTNLDDAGLLQRYGKRVWSRLNEMCVFITMKSADRRLS